MDFQKIFQQYLDLVKRYIPEPKAQSLIGIDIGYSTCKMVEVKARGNSYELVQWGVESFPQGGQAGAIKTLLGKTQHSASALSTAVHGKGTLIRYVELPRMSMGELKKSFAYEADKYLPFTADQVYLDLLVLDPKSKSSKMTVMIAAAKKEIVDERIELFKSMDIALDFVTLNPIAVANIISTLKHPQENNKGDDKGDDKGEAAAIIDIGEKVTNINIIYGGLPRFTRDIFTAGSDFSRQISNTFKVSIEEAEALKYDPGKRKDEIVKACESVALNLISDMRLSLDYFVTEHNVPVTKILLAGGMSLFEGITELFKNYLEIEVGRWDPFEHIIVPDSMKEEVEKVSGELGTALGLALYS